MNRSLNRISSSINQSECVKVVVRCRPMLQKEKENGYAQVVEMNCERGTVQLARHGAESSSLTSSAPNENVKIYTFDSVYDCNSSQEDIYAEIFHPLVDSVLEGFNGTIFAYGQTGTGKTFTMEGDPEHPGVIPRSFTHIFSHIARSNDKQFLVRSSYLEIYQEEIRDLLSSNCNKRLELRERPEVGVYVKDLSSFVCKNIGEIEKVLAKGQHNRSVGSTNMNEHSSRSHAIFIVTIEHTENDQFGTEHIRVGRLNLVDLAGSERQMKTKTVGQRQKEAIKINLSLSALGNVISALVDGRSTHIPYRDSKLTRLLQDSLGGNARTVMVANIGPADYNYEETLITLRYANRAKSIKNRPHVNEDPKDTLIKEFQAEIDRLREQLERKRKLRAIQSSPKHNDADEDKQEEIDVEATEKLQSRIKAMESKMLMGGKNILDHTNQQQIELERRQTEIRERRLRERVMLRRLEEQEEATYEVRETFTSLQQEVELKRKKLRKNIKEFQSINSEINDLHETYSEERRELERISDDLMHDLKLRYLIIDNFIPEYEKTRFLKSVYYDENDEEWHFRASSSQSKPQSPFALSDDHDRWSVSSRPGTSSSHHSRPASYVDLGCISGHGAADSSSHVTQLLLGFHVAFHTGKMDELGLYMPERTTRDLEMNLDGEDNGDDDGVRIEIIDMNASIPNDKMKSAASLKRKIRQQFNESGTMSRAELSSVGMVGKTPPPMRRSLTVMANYNENDFDLDHFDCNPDQSELALPSNSSQDINSLLDLKRANVRRNLFASSNLKDKENLNRRPDTAFPKSRGLVPK